jgi:hypothetical protein
MVPDPRLDGSRYGRRAAGCLRTSIEAMVEYLRVYLTMQEAWKSESNHTLKVASSISLAALTLADHPKAAEWLAYGLHRLYESSDIPPTEDGIYAEGVSYAEYGTREFICLALACENLTGVNVLAAPWRRMYNT